MKKVKSFRINSFIQPLFALFIGFNIESILTFVQKALYFPISSKVFIILGLIAVFYQPGAVPGQKSCNSQDHQSFVFVSMNPLVDPEVEVVVGLSDCV